MESIYRRPSGVYFARIVIPHRLRRAAGRAELIASTGSREAAVAKIVGCEILASWRRWLLQLERPDVDLVQLTAGSPSLLLQGYLSLRRAEAESGIDLETLLAEAAEGRLGLYTLPPTCPGFLVPIEHLPIDPHDGAFSDVPEPTEMPLDALPKSSPGALQLFQEDVEALRDDLVTGRSHQLKVFRMPQQGKMHFVANEPVRASVETLAVLAREVERLRSRLAAGVTKEALALARAPTSLPATTDKSRRRMSEAIEAYMADKAGRMKDDQARRIRAACELFVELMGDLRLCDIDRELIRSYVEDKLPTVPANENKIRLVHHTTSVSASIAAVDSTSWPRLSKGEQAKRAQWLSGLFSWLEDERWINENPARRLAGLVTSGKGKGKAAHRQRDQFTRDELREIFSASWYCTGRGDLTRQGTYREFQPYYYWLPLLGLFTGARINELAQLDLSDVRQTPAGTWYIDINESDDEASGQSHKSVKTANSIRPIPLHPRILDAGFLHWCDALKRQGETRLFPELRYDSNRGYGKAATRWFSDHLKRLGWPRNGRKVFHSFRHTLASECLNVLRLSSEDTVQISGHQRSGRSQLEARYRKDRDIDELAKQVEKLDFGLPPITPFAIDEGLRALRDALGRRHS